ncbi:MAG: TIGR00730 family Rossman fold protein [Candidatus Omnitrophica bacterium CG07_land_8_20_14_0_80_42_15]|uniref:AMP nucleosidase n=1 Tax=Candidatus Aquitaenariimonas noxiae TaxID=1974741 RepID=A0A2J0KSW4_9BACT|nr:MAG: TIGR00730 family Rossman fold protein [Candidatus Omnitrophica bacterium CG07_land_8_20_14_0_80_42_15]
MKSKTKTRRPYIVGDEKIDRIITQLANGYGSGEAAQLLREIITTAIKLGREGGDNGDLKLINLSLKELRYAFRVFSPFRDVRKVIVFGSAKTKKESPDYKLAENFSREIVKRKFMVITGAGPGIMEAANKGAGPGKSFGVNIRLPFEQRENKFIKNSPYLIGFKHFFTRKLIFIKESDATVLFPGGFGTHDEGFENLTLIQTGKCRPRPIVLMEPKGGIYWKSWMSFIKGQLLKRGYISEDDLKLFTYINDVKEAADYVENFYRVYHSIRYVRGLTVMRLKHPLPKWLLRKIKKDFSDILIRGYIKNSGPLEEELKRNEYPYLPRLIMKFNKSKFGRLCDMIHIINKV